MLTTELALMRGEVTAKRERCGYNLMRHILTNLKALAWVRGTTFPINASRSACWLPYAFAFLRHTPWDLWTWSNQHVHDEEQGMYWVTCRNLSSKYS